MIKKFILILFIFTSLNISKTNAQVSIKDSSIFTTMISAHYAFQIPAGDMAERFGNNSAIGGSFQIKTKSNWVFGLNYSYLFGDKIKNEEEIFQDIATEQGFIIDGNGMYADVFMYERGFFASASFGKIIPVFNSNPNSGLFFQGSIGILQHKIRIENSYNTTPQITDDYVKGYDKLSNGLGVSEFIGYWHMSSNRIFSFYLGFEFTQAWTESRRDYDFNQMKKDDTKRFDALNGFKVGWIIPFYSRSAKKIYYY